jgi:hypothetical protein
MNSNKRTGRITGVLFLLIFIAGVSIYQFLQSPLFTENFLISTSSSSNQIIISVLLGILSGITSIIIAIILFPIFKKHSYSLALMYLAFCILSFIAMSIDNISVLSLLELSKEYINSGTEDAASFEILGTMLYKKHWWTHYLTLLISCFPVFVLYYTLFISKLVPKAIAVFGMIAAILMFIEILLSLFGQSISMNMLLPIGLIQLFLPLWLIFKGLKGGGNE